MEGDSPPQKKRMEGDSRKKIGEPYRNWMVIPRKRMDGDSPQKHGDWLMYKLEVLMISKIAGITGW